MKYSTVLFDLDGTLIDTKQGILDSFRNTFHKMGLPQPPFEKLRLCLGPPLRECFSIILGFDKELTEKAIVIYRHDLVESGNAFSGKAFDGIPELLDKLKADGVKLGVATSKVEFLAKRVIENAGLTPMFETVSGPSDDNLPMTKKDSILNAIKKIEGATLENTILIGDRCYDAQGAIDAGVDCIGVFYGYGSREEILSCPFNHTAENCWDVYALLMDKSC